MTEADLPTLAACLVRLADALRERQPTTEDMKVWVEALREFTFSHIEDGIRDCSRRLTRMPAPADVWKFCNEARTRLNLSASKERAGGGVVCHPKLDSKHSQALNATRARMKQASEDDPKDWARIIHFRFVTGQDWRDGQAISATQISFACTALRESIATAYADRNEFMRTQVPTCYAKETASMAREEDPKAQVSPP